MIIDLKDIIDLLVADISHRQPAFAFEREIRLYQFQTWICFPKAPRMVKMAGQLAAAKFLERMETEHLRGKKQLTATRLEHLLENQDYRSLYNTIIARYGGWTKLLRTIPPGVFDGDIQKRRGNAKTVCEMIDYRFRYLDHGGADKQQANIVHSEFYRWKDKGSPLSCKTIRSRWSDNKASAVFLYVSEELDFQFQPRRIRRGEFLERLSEEAADLQDIRNFFGTCAYVAEKIHGSDSDDAAVHIPASVRRLRPKTNPLSDEECERMRDYKQRYEEMRSS
jgi:hypothetical protein